MGYISEGGFQVKTQNESGPVTKAPKMHKDTHKINVKPKKSPNSQIDGYVPAFKSIVKIQSKIVSYALEVEIYFQNTIVSRVF